MESLRKSGEGSQPLGLRSSECCGWLDAGAGAGWQRFLKDNRRGALQWARFTFRPHQFSHGLSHGAAGYKIINVARCWARETGVVLGADMQEQLPPNEYYE